MRKNSQRSDSIAEEFQTSSDINISTIPVQQELHAMGFHGKATACIPHITKYNTKRWLE